MTHTDHMKQSLDLTDLIGIHQILALKNLNSGVDKMHCTHVK